LAVAYNTFVSREESPAGVLLVGAVAGKYGLRPINCSRLTKAGVLFLVANFLQGVPCGMSKIVVSRRFLGVG
jgi:hypothetical protein